MIESSDVYQSIIIDPLDSSRKNVMSLGNSVMELRSPLKKATMCESMMIDRVGTT